MGAAPIRNDFVRRDLTPSAAAPGILAALWLALCPFMADVLAGQGAPGVRVVDRPESRYMDVFYGPIDLPADASHHDVRQLGAHTADIPISGWVHGFEVDIVDAAGREVPRSVLHHVNLIAPDWRELFSPIMRRIGAAGHETRSVMLPRLVGYPVRAGERLMVTAMLHNPTPAPYAGVYVRTRMRYTPRRSWLPRLSVYPFYLDVMPPASKHAYDLPPGRSERSWEGRPSVSGRILGIGGHLHQYGVALRLEDVTRGKVIWEARPRLDEHGQVVSMPRKTFFWRLGLPIRSDRVYRLTAVYDNPTGQTIPDGAMGALGGVMVLGRGETWPAIDAAHPEYLLDLQLVNDTSYGHGPADHGEEAHDYRGSDGHRH